MLNAVDTNVVVRFLTRDDEQQYQQAYKIFKHDRVYIATTVILETEWVLRYAYKYQPSDIVHAFTMLSGLPDVELEDPARVTNALTWHQTGLDFADALHLASSEHCDVLYTFDNDFVKKRPVTYSCNVKRPEKG